MRRDMEMAGKTAGAPGDAAARSAAAAGDALDVRGAGKRYGERLVLPPTDLRLRRGERVALVGESGSGKSTLLNIVAGLERPDTGSVRVAGIALETLDDDGRARLRRERLGFVFQAFHLLPHLSALQNAMLPLLLGGVPPQAARERATELLAALGLRDRAAQLPGTLSGGEQQRVALARALVHRPALLLADEPTGNLDPVTARDALRLLLERCEAAGATLLMVTHSMEAAAALPRRLHLGPDGLRELP